MGIAKDGGTVHIAVKIAIDICEFNSIGKQYNHHNKEMIVWQTEYAQLRKKSMRFPLL